MHLDTRFSIGAKIILDLIQIERPGESDGTVIPWNYQLLDLAEDLAKELNIAILNPLIITKTIEEGRQEIFK